MRRVVPDEEHERHIHAKHHAGAGAVECDGGGGAALRALLVDRQVDLVDDLLGEQLRVDEVLAVPDHVQSLGCEQRHELSLASSQLLALTFLHDALPKHEIFERQRAVMLSVIALHLVRHVTLLSPRRRCGIGAESAEYQMLFGIECRLLYFVGERIIARGALCGDLR